MLCAGLSRRDGWKTLDANPERGADIVAVIPPLPPEVVAERWDEIELVHGITSFYPWEAEELLKQIRQVLAPGGKLVLEQPDFRIAINRVEWLFGDPSLREPRHMNRWAYTPESLMAAVIAAGFSHGQVIPAVHHSSSRDFRLEARCDG